MRPPFSYNLSPFSFFVQEMFSFCPFTRNFAIAFDKLDGKGTRGKIPTWETLASMVAASRVASAFETLGALHARKATVNL